MPTSRLPGALSSSLLFAANPLGNLNGAIQNFATANPIGYYWMAPARGRNPRGGKELTVLGDFPSPWKNDREEIEALTFEQEATESHWHPGTNDWLKLASNSHGGKGKAFFTIHSVGEFVGMILLQPVGSIKRINIMTHGAASEIAFSGVMDREGGVSFDESLDLGTLAGFQEHGVEIHRKGKWVKVDWNEVQRRFARDAEIVIYACNVALGDEYLQAIANFFDVTAKGFDDYLDFFVPFENGAVLRNEIRVAKHEQANPNAAKNNGVKDFHKLIPNIEIKPEPQGSFPD